MYDIATAKLRLGINDATMDPLVQLALDSALAVAEKYCDRQFAYRADVARFYNFGGDTLFLPRYPIEAVFATNGLPDSIEIHHRLGTIEIGSYVTASDIRVDYSGGYRVFPPDLELAFWGIFDTIYPTLSGATPAAVESVTIPDVGTIRYAKGNNGSTSIDANVLGAYYSVLETYRRLTC